MWLLRTGGRLLAKKRIRADEDAETVDSGAGTLVDVGDQREVGGKRIGEARLLSAREEHCHHAGGAGIVGRKRIERRRNRGDRRPPTPRREHVHGGHLTRVRVLVDHQHEEYSGLGQLNLFDALCARNVQPTVVIAVELPAIGQWSVHCQRCTTSSGTQPRKRTTHHHCVRFVGLSVAALVLIVGSANVVSVSTAGTSGVTTMTRSARSSRRCAVGLGVQSQHGHGELEVVLRVQSTGHRLPGLFGVGPAGYVAHRHTVHHRKVSQHDEIPCTLILLNITHVGHRTVNGRDQRNECTRLILVGEHTSSLTALGHEHQPVHWAPIQLWLLLVAVTTVLARAAITAVDVVVLATERRARQRSHEHHHGVGSGVSEALPLSGERVQNPGAGLIPCRTVLLPEGVCHHHQTLAQYHHARHLELRRTHAAAVARLILAPQHTAHLHHPVVVVVVVRIDGVCRRRSALSRGQR
mmetsp:Transcript_14116/g.42506  ORF Transcript_14116/g.42506 Transcript_14116/m.42506 type:complete len:467 (-) Transcript_14116:208-1608(-)